MAAGLADASRPCAAAGMIVDSAVKKAKVGDPGGDGGVG